MAFDFYKLLSGTLITNSITAVYTNTASITTFMRLITLCNFSDSSVTISVYRVPNSGGSVGTAADKDLIFKGVVSGGSTVLFDVPNPGFILDSENDTLQVVASITGVSTIHIDGGKE